MNKYAPVWQHTLKFFQSALNFEPSINAICDRLKHSKNYQNALIVYTNITYNLNF